MPRSTKNLLMVAAIALAISVGIVWDSNNVAAVKRSIGQDEAKRHTEIDFDSFNSPKVFANPAQKARELRKLRKRHDSQCASGNKAFDLTVTTL